MFLNRRYPSSSRLRTCSVQVLLILACGVTCLGDTTAEDNPPHPPPTAPPLQTTSLTTDPLRNLLVISTLDGTLTALDRVSGTIRWISHDKPMIQVPLTNNGNQQQQQPPPDPTAQQQHQNQSKLPKAPYFLPDPKTGSLYMMGKQNSLRKLPFTIPQLVAMAPCKNSEGLMYTGRKLDMWLSLNPYTGEKREMPMDGSGTGSAETCPKWSASQDSKKHQHHCTSSEDEGSSSSSQFTQSVLIGKTEYTLSMMDGPRKWNVTYHHYSSNDMSSQSLQDYELVHFSSPSEGHLMTYERKSGDLAWQVELSSPVVGLYIIDDRSTNLVSVPFNPIASDTLERLKNGESAKKESALNPTTYVGECAYGLYAVPALADEHVLVLGDGADLPRLIEGPDSISPGGDPVKILDRTSGDGDYLLLGYYKVGSDQGSGSGFLPPMIEGGGATVVPEEPESQFNDSKIIFPPPIPTQPPQQQPQPEKQQQPQHRPDTTPNIPTFPPPLPKKPTKEDINIVVTTAVLSIGITSCVLGACFIVYRRYKNQQFEYQVKMLSTDSNASGERGAGNRGSGGYTGELTVGKITLYPGQVLGKGCEGTFVYKGKFEGRDVAVKRILPECFSLADREVDLLKESDQHVNVIRYFCTESDGQFRYIALELCVATLSDWVENRWNSGDLQIDGVDLLRDATEGLRYLHSLRIVHRDVKPANVLLSLGSGSHSGMVRTMISDFGLCKKIRDGRGSYSRRSGGVPGTEGWIAPEVLEGRENAEGRVEDVAVSNARMTYSVDIFSMGCVYYYVLTRGQHPFGDALRRQYCIINNKHDLKGIVDNPRGAYNLIRTMISKEPDDRPPLRAILTHPMFWVNDKVLGFFLDVSDRIEKETEDSFPLLRKLEMSAADVVKGDWRDHICSHVAMDLRKYRTYKGENIRDLLRALRNKKNHYRELTTDAQESLGTVPDGFVDYWVNRFPLLLEHVYTIFEGVKSDTGFSRYYDADFDWGDGEDFTNYEYEGNKSYDATPEKNDDKKLGKEFWRSKSQAKYQKWRGNGGGGRMRGSPHRNNKPPPEKQDGDGLSASTDNYWRGRSPSAGGGNNGGGAME